MKTTLHDIADKTGLSISTISRVLRGESKTNSKNVDLVIEAAQELNYQINTRLLNSVYQFKKTMHIALICDIHVGEFYASFFYGLEKSTSDEDVILGLYNTKEELGAVQELLRALSNDNIDAAILFLPSLKEHEYYKILDDAPKDFIIVSAASVFHPVLDTVTFDSYRGGYLTAKHFEEKGYKEVGIITGPIHRHEALLRKSGFTDYIDHRSDMKLVWQYLGDYTFDCGKDAYKDFKESDHKPRAIFSSNDYMALGFVEEAIKDGKQFPEDIAISGYDNLPICDFVQPGITSVKTDFIEMGKTIFSVIKEKMGKNEGHRGVSSIVPVELEIRNSS